MSTRVPAPAPGHDILARYLNAYVHARQLSDLERPWGLGDDALDSLWSRLTEALAGNPRRLDRMIAEDLSEKDREHIVATLAPLIFALPLRAYPSELRAVRSGSRLNLTLRHFGTSEPAASPERPAPEGLHLPKAPAAKKARLSGKARRGSEESIGFLPSALTPSFLAHLRRALKVRKSQQRRELTVSSGGRRRRVRLTFLTRGKGVLVRFLERLPSPADEKP